MKNTTIVQRLAAAFGLLTLMLATMAGVALLQLKSIGTDVDLVLDDLLPKQRLLVEVESEANEVARALRNLFIMTEAEGVQAQQAEIKSSRERMRQLMAELDRKVTRPEARQLLAAVIAGEAAYQASESQVMAALAAGRSDEARTTLLKEARPLQLAYVARLDALTEFQNRLIDEGSRHIDGAKATMRNLLWGLAIAGVLVAVLLSVLIVRSITRPLGQAMTLAETIAAGDLSTRIVADGRSETDRLLRTLARMQDHLAGLVAGVRRGADSVATASAQIAQGNADLSQRTEEQASSLEQTAASMEQLGTTVKLNADNAHQASQLAQGASTVASQGGAVVAQVVDTMKGIHESSRRIADIIGTIDGIAFQTNILALNAAVEAARAGDQGRGFAVVAGEVRSLAQRSAEAAREIKSLITASGERVEAGSALVERAGSTMQEVVESIRRVSDIVAEISAASSEQSAGVGQVGQAVSQMDQVTQQNAALVEEGTAAADSLRQQADQLVGAVAVFRLTAEAG